MTKTEAVNIATPQSILKVVIYGLLTKLIRSRWLDIGLFFYEFIDLDGSSFLRVNSQKKNGTRPISSHVDRSSLVNKGLIIWLSRKFFLRDTAGSPERAR